MNDELLKELENDLIPKQGSLKHSSGKKSSRKKSSKKEAAESATWQKSINPFEGASQLIKFYHHVMLELCRATKFEEFAVDIVSAGEVLDTLLDNDVTDDKFLREWMGYYSKRYLKGRKVQNPRHTSLRAFSKSFDDFKKLYVGTEL